MGTGPSGARKSIFSSSISPGPGNILSDKATATVERKGRSQELPTPSSFALCCQLPLDRRAGGIIYRFSLIEQAGCVQMAVSGCLRR
jgi:hypothetical protein